MNVLPPVCSPLYLLIMRSRHTKFYVQNNPFYTVICNILLYWPIVKFKNKHMRYSYLAIPTSSSGALCKYAFLIYFNFQASHKNFKSKKRRVWMYDIILIKLILFLKYNHNFKCYCHELVFNFRVKNLIYAVTPLVFFTNERGLIIIYSYY